MITSEDVKEAIINQLLSTFPDVAIYKEAISNPKYPHFFIHQISVIDEEERKDYHTLLYSMDIRYRTVSDPSTDLKLNQNLDDVALKLFSNFNTIDFNDSKIKCIDKSAEKESGVLHFFVSFNILAKLVDTNKQETKFDKLEVNIGKVL